jgi:hypothetical protein
MTNSDKDFIDEVFHPQRYKACTVCGEMVNESSLRELVESAEGCGNGSCPYKQIVDRLDDNQWG